MGKKLNEMLDLVALERRAKIAERARLRAALKDAVPDPSRITPLSESLIEQAVKATRGVVVSDSDEIPDDVSI